MTTPNQTRPISQWLAEVQRIIRERYAHIYGSKYVADRESWEYSYIEGLTPQAAVQEDLSHL